MMHLLVVIAVLFMATVNAGVLTPNPSSSSTYKGAVVLDDSPYIAPGTPFQKAKIADSVVDLIGGTPLVRFSSPSECFAEYILTHLCAFFR